MKELLRLFDAMPAKEKLVFLLAVNDINELLLQGEDVASVIKQVTEKHNLYEEQVSRLVESCRAGLDRDRQ